VNRPENANFLMLGREVNAPADIVYGLEHPEPAASYDDFVREKLNTAYEIVRQNSSFLSFLLQSSYFLFLLTKGIPIDDIGETYYLD